MQPLRPIYTAWADVNGETRFVRSNDQDAIRATAQYWTDRPWASAVRITQSVPTVPLTVDQVTGTAR